jgi:outer membrane protein TolC
VLTAVLLGQAGCTTSVGQWINNGFKVGPNYQPPEAPLPAHWIDEGNARVAVGEPHLADWWDVFGDPVLSKLIHQAAAQNLTVRQAGIQILQAKIQRNIAMTELLPQAQSLALQYSHGVVSRNNGVGPGAIAIGTAYTPSTAVSPPSTPTTPIAGATPFTTAGTTTTGTNSSINAVAAGGGGGVPEGDSRFFNNIATSLNLSWELDLWGLFRRNLEAADASLDQSVANYDVIMIQLLATVATQYIELRTLQKRLALARQNVILQEPLVAKLKQQFEAQMPNSKPAYYQLKSNLDNTRALIPPLEIALRQANNQLCNLVGIPVRDLLPELGDGVVADAKDPAKKSVRIPRAIDDSVVVGIPGDILLKRPDVVAIEEQLRIQSAQIGIAEAEMLPHVGINGNIGLAADRLGRLFNQQSWIGSIGPTLTWNILAYGRLLANVRFQNELYQQHVLAYQQAILNANQDVENALVAYLQSLEQHKYLQDSANDAYVTSTYYYDQLAKGYLPPAQTSQLFYNLIFTAINFQVSQQDAAAQAEGNIALNLILLYRALGGGWQIRLKDGDGHCGPDGTRSAPSAPVSRHDGFDPHWPDNVRLPAAELPPPRPTPTPAVAPGKATLGGPEL